MRLVFGLALLLPTVAAAEQCFPSDEESLRKLKLDTWPAIYRRQDISALDALLLDGARTVDATGAVTTKADELRWLRNNAWTESGFTYRIDTLECFGDTAIVIGEGMNPSEKDGRTVRTTYVSSNVFVRKDGRWRVALSHLAPSKVLRD